MSNSDPTVHLLKEDIMREYVYGEQTSTQVLENMGCHVADVPGLEIRLHRVHAPPPRPPVLYAPPDMPEAEAAEQKRNLPAPKQTPDFWQVAYRINAQVYGGLNAPEDGGAVAIELVYPGDDGEKKVQRFTSENGIPGQFEGVVAAGDKLTFTPYFRIVSE